MPDVDGALVGGASLLSDKFARICEFTPPDRPRSNPRQLVAREVVGCRNVLGESPVWSARSQRLFWISAPERELWSWNMRDSPFKRTFAQAVGCIALVDDGRLLVQLEDQSITYDVESATSAHLVRTPEPERLTRLNDGRVDRSGQLVLGMYNNFHRSGLTAGDDIAGLYRLTATGFDEILSYKFRVSNAICFSPDGGTLYFCDSPTRKVYAFTYDAAAAEPLSDRRLVYTMPSHLNGSPDGAQVDADGRLWLALSGAGQVVQICPATGEVLLVVLLPVSSPTSATFGGALLDTLYITTRGPDGGGLFAVQLPFGIRGLAEPEVAASLVAELAARV
ncbi:SMP-30/Gluconolaconase/LRE-like region-domain-containing protein [Pavlovales sp. CCMP2436]|nr:SMP-30/Gluconolaconase/LRE-like region-domain-containing protein [Pavlovales sp. CCMP2436]